MISHFYKYKYNYLVEMNKDNKLSGHYWPLLLIISVSHDFWHMLQTKIDRDMNSTEFSSFLFPHQVVY